MSVPISVDECLADVLGRLRPSLAYPHLLLESLGLTASEDVVAPAAIPPVPCASVDGYAVRAIDTQGASPATPVTLNVVGQQAATGSCVAVAAGAALPAGTDAVVPLGETDFGVASVRVMGAAYTGQWVRAAGDDVAKGAVILARGERVGPRHIGLLAGLGIDQVAVVPRPRVVVISAGAELVEPGRNTGTGESYDANSYLLAATVRDADAIAYRVRVSSDDPAEFAEVLDDQLVRADLVVITGGRVDAARRALSRESGVVFREVGMRPGPQLGYGSMGPERTPIFVLPANPVAAYVSFTTFVAPALRRLSGLTPESRPLFRAKLTDEVVSSMGRRHFVCARFESDANGARVTPTGGAGDDMLGGLADANALIVLREDVAKAAAGEAVPIILLDREY